MEKKISYLNRNYEDYRQALIDFSKKYYGDMEIEFNDASIASWLIDINADIADNLSYHIDRVFQETNINSANERASLYALARNNGFKVPGPKGAMAEVEFSCYIPMSSTTKEPDYDYAPIIRRGTKLAGGNQLFELLDDVDFSLQFDSNGNSNRTIYPIVNSNGIITQYKITKLAVVVAGETKIYKKVVRARDIVPFMEILIPETSVMNVESIVVKDGDNYITNPTYGEFYYDGDEEQKCEIQNKRTYRYFEVESLAQQYRWGDVTNKEGKAVSLVYNYVSGSSESEYTWVIPTYCVTKGKWKEVKHKFITEYTDKGYLKVIFGAGVDPNVDIDITGSADFSKFQIQRIIQNDNLGYLPNPNSTVFILYRSGGGKASNLAQGAINNIVYLNAEIGGSDSSVRESVKNTISVVSTTPSVSGKDMPTEQELKYLIKYNSGSQNRCVTVKDYVAQLLKLPPRYGTPFRVGVNEENNKIMLYLLGLDYQGKLDSTLPTALIQNVRDYIAAYRMINDYIEIKSGKIINIGFDVDLYIDKNYNKSDVIANVITVISNYMDVNQHIMGDDIFVGDIQKEVSKVDGVLNVIKLEVYNYFGGNNGVYSPTRTTQETDGDVEAVDTASRIKIDLEASDWIVYSEGDSMLEVKYPESDIRVRCKVR
jgi:hypothetical protein